MDYSATSSVGWGYPLRGLVGFLGCTGFRVQGISRFARVLLDVIGVRGIRVAGFMGSGRGLLDVLRVRVDGAFNNSVGCRFLC